MPVPASLFAARSVCLSFGIAAALSGCSGGGDDGGDGASPGESGQPVELGAALPDTPGVQFTVASGVASESERHVPVEVVRTGDGVGRTVVRYLISGGSATPGLDLVSVQGQLVWEDGQSGARTIDLQVFSDVESEREESVELSLEPLEGDDVSGGEYALTLQDADCSGTLPTRVEADLALADPCYRLTADVQVVADAQLSLSAGTTLLADAGTGLEVLENATLVTTGTSLRPVTLAGTDPEAGWWRGVLIDSEAVLHRLDGLRLRDAQTGVELAPGSTLLSLAGGSIGNVSMVAARVPLEAVDGFDGNTAIDSAAGVAVSDGRIGRGETVAMPALSTHYSLTAGLLVSGELEVEAGAQLRFVRAGRLLIDADGSVQAIGTPAAPIVFRGAQFEPGFWLGISLQGSVGDNRLEHVVVANGGADSTRDGNLSVFGETTRLAASDVSLAGSAGVGLWLDTRLPNVTLQRIEFAENAVAEVRQGAASGDLDTLQD